MRQIKDTKIRRCPNVAKPTQNQPLCNYHQFIFLVLALTCYLSFHPAQAYLITVDAGADNDCFHERVPVGTKLSLSFEVIEGGFYDIDVEIKSPTNVILHREERSSNGKFTIETSENGPYSFCFSNKKSSFNPKVIIFDIDKSNEVNKREPQNVDENNKEESETAKLDSMIGNLILSAISARHDVRYLAARDKVHRKVNESTNKTIVWWSGVEFFLLLSVTLGQVWYLKRFFEIRRKA